MLNKFELFFLYVFYMQVLAEHVWALNIPSPVLQEETQKHLTWELRDALSYPGSITKRQWDLSKALHQPVPPFPICKGEHY